MIVTSSSLMILLLVFCAVISGDQQKLDESHFTSKVLPSILQLWAMSDRTVRTSLLKTLKSLTPFLSSDTVNKKIFDPLLAGFGDSNVK